MADAHRSHLKPLIIGTLLMGLIALATLAIRGFVTLSELDQSGEEAASRQAKQWEAERERRIAARAKIDVAKAYSELQRKAGVGDTDAMLLLSSILMVGMEEIIQIDPANGLRTSSSDQLEILVGKQFDELFEQPFTNVPVVRPDPIHARLLLEKAARQGQAEAQVRLAHELEHSDPPQALRWIMIADRGWPADKPTIFVGTDELRNELRSRLLGRLSPEKIAEAQYQATYFRPTKQ
jgi:TPR repeat protein